MNREVEVKRVAILGILGNLILLTLKLIVGLISGSQAMIADGFNSAGDVFASAMTFVGNHLASKPYDHDHPYGHGKAEYVFSMIISFSLMLVALSIFKNGFLGLFTKATFIYSFNLILVSLITIVSKFFFYRYAMKIGKKHNSLLAFANAEDHRNDIFVTSVTFASILTGYYNWYLIDSIAAMGIAMWIAYSGFTIFSSSYQVLIDTTLELEVKEKMKEDIEAVEGVDHFDAIVSKPVGLNYILIVKVSVDANLTIAQGHQIGDAIKSVLMDYELVEDVIVHLNPAQDHPQKDYLK